MPDIPAIIGSISLLVLTFFGLRFYFRRMRLSVYIGSWGDLAAHHTMLSEPLGLRWHSSSVRVGTVTYNNTMNVAVQHGGLYLQRNSFSLSKTTLFLPAASLTLISRHKAS
jgi:hypothetical protein